KLDRRFLSSAGSSKWTTGFIFASYFLIWCLIWWVEAAVSGPASRASCECIIASRLAAKQGFVAAGRNPVLAWARRARAALGAGAQFAQPARARRESVVRAADTHDAAGSPHRSCVCPNRPACHRCDPDPVNCTARWTGGNRGAGGLTRARIV